jgi:DNA (cytosine-5)-methyltransferase 1
VIQEDIRTFDASPYHGVDLVAAGVPCPPFSMAGKQLGSEDERDLFPAALRIVEAVRPRAVMLENVRGLASERFASYRASLKESLRALGYESEGRLLNASGFGVPQLRPRYVIVGLQKADFLRFAWPAESSVEVSVGEAIGDLMGACGWPGTAAWVERANRVAPTLVGGSRKHGGPDLGPTRARKQWAELGVDGIGVAAAAPGSEDSEDATPRLTVRMAARLQGFPDSWQFAGGKTAAYRQVGNAFPPPVAQAVANAIRAAAEGHVPIELPRRQLQLLEPVAAFGAG